MGTPMTNQRHERFAQEIATGKHAVEAYRAVAGAGRPGEREMGSRWLTRVDVQRRVAELIRASATKATVTAAERREIAAEIARDKTVAPAVRLSATVIEAKHAGEFMERAELRKDGAIPPLDFSSLTRNLPAIFFQPRQVDAEADTNGHANGTTAAAGVQP